MNIKTLIRSLVSLFYPEQCVVCKNILIEGEEFLCLHCLLDFPKTNHHLCPNNVASKNLTGKVIFENASAYLFYSKGGMSQAIVAEIKYKGNRRFGRWIGSYLASDIKDSGFFNGIDLLVPIPLHMKKLRKRGFNQSEIISKGISDVTGIPVDNTSLYRSIANPTQTKKGSFERWLNTKNIFEVKENPVFEGKHILLFDDVLTTGSTIEAAINTINKKCKNARISILTLALSC
ncbi:MAG: ComF family protein [Dysgonamonadaceae bacterium]|jgi:ComF family protein|nr:ComF family protein [Dysgonamonadaceae bacterium]